MEQPVRRQYFENINGLRFLGALGVLFFHCSTLPGKIWGEFSEGYWYEKVYFLLGRGHLGIILFFVISGFLITSILLWEFEAKGKIQTGKFFLRRLLRVWPLYFLVLFFGFSVFPNMPYGIETLHELWRYLLFLPNIDEIIIGPDDSINFLSTLWSLGVEEQFYIVWGLLLSILTLRGRFNRSIFIGICLSIILGSFVFRAMYLGDERILHYHTFSVMSDLAIGCLLAIWTYSGKAKSYFENIPRWQIGVFYVVAMLLLIYEGHIFRDSLFVFGRILPAVIIGMIILEQVFCKNSIVKLDRIPLVSFSGEITYSIYIVHSIYIYYWGIYFDSHGYTSTWTHYIAFFAVVFVSSYLTSIVTYFLVERPFFQLRKYFR
ncbi:MAG: hypothetical protein Crog4KO_33800 [Crocinitomicaceae bacterium]